LLTAVAISGSLPAYAQLTSVDHGLAVQDSSGLMFANTVGINLSYSQPGNNYGAQAWISSLNAEDYGGYHDWTFITGNSTVPGNTTTNQMGELFYKDCGNVAGSASSFGHAGKNCSSFSALNSTLKVPTLYFSSSPYSSLNNPAQPWPSPDFFFSVYFSQNSSQGAWTNDSQYTPPTGGFPLVGVGDIIAVRAAPEIDASTAASGLALLIGGLTILRARRRAILSM